MVIPKNIRPTEQKQHFNYHEKLAYIILLTFFIGCSTHPMNQIAKVNQQINQEIKYFDNPIDWQLPVDNVGDCTSIAMVKQLELKKLGIESNLAACYTPELKGHAVLLVGDKVLDMYEPAYQHINKSTLICFMFQDGNVWRDRWGREVESPLGLALK
jgi:predicted transglutaminase-like cysteine proteinase